MLYLLIYSEYTASLNTHVMENRRYLELFRRSKGKSCILKCKASAFNRSELVFSSSSSSKMLLYRVVGGTSKSSFILESCTNLNIT